MQVPLAGLNPLANPEVRPWPVGVQKHRVQKMTPLSKKRLLAWLHKFLYSRDPIGQAKEG
jgi:hypothetical protein